MQDKVFVSKDISEHWLNILPLTVFYSKMIMALLRSWFMNRVIQSNYRFIGCLERRVVTLL